MKIFDVLDIIYGCKPAIWVLTETIKPCLKGWLQIYRHQHRANNTSLMTPPSTIIKSPEWSYMWQSTFSIYWIKLAHKQVFYSLYKSKSFQDRSDQLLRDV